MQGKPVYMTLCVVFCLNVSVYPCVNIYISIVDMYVYALKSYACFQAVNMFLSKRKFLGFLYNIYVFFLTVIVLFYYNSLAVPPSFNLPSVVGIWECICM